MNGAKRKRECQRCRCEECVEEQQETRAQMQRMEDKLDNIMELLLNNTEQSYANTTNVGDIPMCSSLEEFLERDMGFYSDHSVCRDVVETLEQRGMVRNLTLKLFMSAEVLLKYNMSGTCDRLSFRETNLYKNILVRKYFWSSL